MDDVEKLAAALREQRLLSMANDFDYRLALAVLRADPSLFDEAREQGAREERQSLLGRLQMYALRNGWSHDDWKALDDVMRLPWKTDDEPADAP